MVWKDLRKHGWREDLRHESQVSIHYVDEAKSAPLPSLSQEVLLSEDFYEAATNEKATAEVAQITTFICRNNSEASVHVVQALLHRAQSAPGGWKGERFVDGCITSLASLLDLEDSLQKDRMQLTMLGTFGILTVARKLSTSLEEPQVRDTYKMIKVLLQIKKKSAMVTAWLDERKEEWSWMGEWLKDASLQPALGYTPAFGRHYSKMETLRALTEVHGGENVKRFPNDSNDAANGDSYRVQGAGADIVNGVYECCGENDGVPMFAKHGTPAFKLYRCSLNSGLKRWYISDVASQTPGTSADIDYYWAGIEDWKGAPSPPRDGWITCKTAGMDPTSGAADPAPTVTAVDLANSMAEMEI